MVTQDSLRFYKDHSVYGQFGGVVLDREEGRRIAECLGGGKAIILQNHGLLTVSVAPCYRDLPRACVAPADVLCSSQVGETVDAAAFWFMSLDKTCHAQLLIDAAVHGSGLKKTFIPEEEARFSFAQVGTPEKGWVCVQELRQWYSMIVLTVSPARVSALL